VDTGAGQTATSSSSHGVDMVVVNRQLLPPRLLLLLLPPRQTIHTLRMVATRPIVQCTTQRYCNSKQQPEVRRALLVRLVPKLSTHPCRHPSSHPTITIGSHHFFYAITLPAPTVQPRVM